MTNIDDSFSALAQQLKKSQLLTFSVDAGLTSVYLEFATHNGNVDIKIKLGGVVLLDLFKEIDDVDSFYIVAAESKVVEGDTDELFQSLRGQSDHLRQILTRIAARPIYHLYLEGDINLDLLATKYEWVS